MELINNSYLSFSFSCVAYFTLRSVLFSGSIYSVDVGVLERAEWICHKAPIILVKDSTFVWIDSSQLLRNLNRLNSWLKQLMKAGIRFNSWFKRFRKSVIRFNSRFKQKRFDYESPHDSTHNRLQVWRPCLYLYSVDACTACLTLVLPVPLLCRLTCPAVAFYQLSVVLSPDLSRCCLLSAVCGIVAWLIPLLPSISCLWYCRLTYPAVAFYQLSAVLSPDLSRCCLLSAVCGIVAWLIPLLPSISCLRYCRLTYPAVTFYQLSAVLSPDLSRCCPPPAVQGREKWPISPFLWTWLFCSLNFLTVKNKYS